MFGQYSTTAIITSNETDEAMPCIVAGCDLDGMEDDGDKWFPEWAEGGRVFLGMNCGGHN